MKEYIVSQEYIDGIYTDEGSTFGLDMQKELIRCKDCKFYEDHKRKIYENCTWNNHIIARTPNDFCSRAERRNDETDWC